MRKRKSAMQAMPRVRGQERNELKNVVLDAIERHHGEHQREHEQPDAVANDVVAKQKGRDDPRCELPACDLDRHQSEPNVNTRNERVSVITVWYNPVAPAGARAFNSQSSHASRRRRSGATANTTAIEMRGTVQSADLR
jgi:hypothetical protein